MNMNPEFRRNLWLNFSLLRLLFTPVILGSVAALAYALNKEEWRSSWHDGFSLLAGAVIFLWGSYAAMDSVNSEIRDRTWDLQRLSSLTPWQMAWGKLFGATAYTWYVALFCGAFLFAASAHEHDKLVSTAQTFGTFVCAGIALHASLMAERLHTLDLRERKGNVFIRFMGVMLILSLAATVYNLIFLNFFNKNLWWRKEFSNSELSLIVSALALPLALLALWRSMAVQLMLRTLPWAWPLGLSALGLIFAGFTENMDKPSFIFLTLTATALIASCYALFTQRTDVATWRGVFYYGRHSGIKRMLQAMPLWPVSWLLAVGFLVAYITQPEPITTYDGQTLQTHLLLTLITLHVLRDAGIYMLLATERNQYKPQGIALLVYGVLSAALPLALFYVSPELPKFVEPLFSVDDFIHGKLSAPLYIGIMLMHLLIVAALLVWRYHSSALKEEQTGAWGN